MNDQILKGEWTQLKGEIQKTWGKITGSELDQIEGQWDNLAGLLQQKYGYTLDNAKKHVDALKEKYDKISLQGEWNEVKGEILQAWGKLTEDEVAKVNGSKTRLVGLIQQKYAKEKIKATKEVEAFINRLR